MPTDSERIAALEKHLASSDLFSTKFINRALAVYGHYIVASLVMFAIVMAIAFFAGIFGV